jgi:hypothetical protein
LRELVSAANQGDMQEQALGVIAVAGTSSDGVLHMWLPHYRTVEDLRFDAMRQVKRQGTTPALVMPATKELAEQLGFLRKGGPDQLRVQLVPLSITVPYWDAMKVSHLLQQPQ